MHDDPASAHQAATASVEEDEHAHRGHVPDEHQHAGPASHRFEDTEKWSQVFDDPERDVWQKPDEVVAAMQLEPGMVVADLGAGTGYFLGRLSQAVGPKGKVLALDVEPTMAAHMTMRAEDAGWTNVEARVVEPADPALGSNTVDRILIVDTWHHISDRSEYAKKLAAALRPGGQVHVVDFDLDSRRGPPREHKLPLDVVVQELQAGGLEVQVLQESLPDQYIVMATRPEATPSAR